MINIGQYIETLINWMMIHFSTFFDALNILSYVDHNSIAF